MVVVRLLGAGDEETLVKLAFDAPELDVAGRTAPQQPLAHGDAVAYLTDPSVLHWVAEAADGTIAGDLLCYIERRPSDSPRQLLLYEIGVRTSLRRRGVGTELLRAMRDWMAEAAVTDVWVLADNGDAEQFYAAFGFERDEEQPVAMSLVVEP
jgi:GNAT superfamily N-acetyltransferase